MIHGKFAHSCEKYLKLASQMVAFSGIIPSYLLRRGHRSNIKPQFLHTISTEIISFDTAHTALNALPAHCQTSSSHIPESKHVDR